MKIIYALLLIGTMPLSATSQSDIKIEFPNVFDGKNVVDRRINHLSEHSIIISQNNSAKPYPGLKPLVFTADENNNIDIHMVTSMKNMEVYKKFCSGGDRYLEINDSIYRISTELLKNKKNIKNYKILLTPLNSKTLLESGETKILVENATTMNGFRNVYSAGKFFAICFEPAFGRYSELSPGVDCYVFSTESFEQVYHQYVPVWNQAEDPFAENLVLMTNGDILITNRYTISSKEYKTRLTNRIEHLVVNKEGITTQKLAIDNGLILSNISVNTEHSVAFLTHLTKVGERIQLKTFNATTGEQIDMKSIQMSEIEKLIPEVFLSKFNNNAEKRDIANSGTSSFTGTYNPSHGFFNSIGIRFTAGLASIDFNLLVKLDNQGMIEWFNATPSYALLIGSIFSEDGSVTMFSNDFDEYYDSDGKFSGITNSNNSVVINGAVVSAPGAKVTRISPSGEVVERRTFTELGEEYPSFSGLIRSQLHPGSLVVSLHRKGKMNTVTSDNDNVDFAIIRID